MSYYARRAMFGVLALAVVVAACDSATTDARSGSVSVYLTDAPGYIVEAWVTVTDIYFQGRGGEEDPPHGRAYLLEGGTESYELLSLANDVAEVVREVEVPTGTYGQLRMVLSGGCIVTEDGRVFASPGYDQCGAATGTLHMPSMAQSGVKVLLHGYQVTSGHQGILLDFDVSQSFGREAGQSNRWVMKPVIHGARIEEAAGVTATLALGEDVTLPDGFELGDFSATLEPAEGDVSDADFVEDNGTFRADFRFLWADHGPFEVTLNVPEGLEVTLNVGVTQSVSPNTGQVAEINWVIESAVEVEDDDD